MLQISDVLQLATDVRDVAVAALAEQMEASRRHEQQLKAQFSAQLRAERALWQTLNERQQVRASARDVVTSSRRPLRYTYGRQSRDCVVVVAGAEREGALGSGRGAGGEQPAGGAVPQPGAESRRGEPDCGHRLRADSYQVP